MLSNVSIVAALPAILTVFGFTNSFAVNSSVIVFPFVAYTGLSLFEYNSNSYSDESTGSLVIPGFVLSNLNPPLTFEFVFPDLSFNVFTHK